ncbi:MAG: DUF1365 domain-containing protein [Burkholderiales bacterium]|nr:DUF1365 domain-containing protein [Burkholderiales bacterium]
MNAATSAQTYLARGQVWHTRLRPASHTFRHNTYFLLLPMRSRAQHGGPVPRRRWGLITFVDEDHGLGGKDALAWIESLLHEEGIDDADGEIWLQTYPRVLGHAFKPVSFWYAHRADGSLAAVVAEVNNTFGERHCYLLQGPELRWGQDMEATKVFHVSPFCQVEGRYRFRFARTAEHIMARVDLHDEHGPLIQTSMSGALHPFTATAAHCAFWSTPLLTLGVVARIHWHALRLWLKRVPFFHKPAAPERFVTR